MMTSEGSWIDRARELKKTGEPVLSCHSCSNKFPASALKPYGKDKKLMCEPCIDKEDKKREKREARRVSAPAEPRARQPAVDMSSIGDMIKNAIKESIQPVDMASILNAISGIKTEMEGMNREPGHARIPMELTKKSLFSFICNAKHVVLGEFVSIFGDTRMHAVKVKLLAMWRDNWLWKNTAGRYMVNPELPLPKFKEMNVEMADGEFVTYITAMRQQAIDKKFKPFEMVGKMKGYILDMIGPEDEK